jgi:dTDP-4-dehydrorhamnose 3,5-epimerase
MEKNSVFYYKMAYRGEFNDVDKQQTIKWDSKKFNIEWPCTNPIISKRDANGKDS